MNPNGHAHDLDQVAVYALGALPEAQARDVARIIATCAECRAEYALLRDAACCIGWTAELPIGSTQAPRPLVKAAIMEAIRPSAVPSIAPSSRRRAWPAYLVAAAAIVIAIFSAISNASMRSEVAALKERNGSLAARIATEAQGRAADRQILAALLASDAQHFAVGGGDVVRYRDMLLVAMRQLPPPPKGKVYQAWTLAHGATAVAPSATFVPSKAGWVVVALPEKAAGIDAVALSVEPDGGSKAPTSKPLFVRKLTNA